MSSNDKTKKIPIKYQYMAKRVLTGFQGSECHSGHSSPTLHGCTVLSLGPSY